MQGCNDALRIYKATIIEIKDKAFLAKGEENLQQTLVHSQYSNDVIKGTVFEVTQEELLVADKYGPENYNRITVMLQSGKEAWVYIAE